jgi:diacylglycerol kinase
MNYSFETLHLNSMLQTFKHAIAGIIWAFKKERNLKIHAVAAVLVCLLGLYFEVTNYEWIVLLLCIGLVISAELFNTAIEKTLDLLHPQIDTKVKIIKDISAGAVFVLSIVAVIVGFVVLWF